MKKITNNDLLLYETCPYKWALSKSVPKAPSQMFAFYRFGSAIHYAVSEYLSKFENITEVFNDTWHRYQEMSLVYETDESWSSLAVLGNMFLEQFSKQFSGKNIDIILCEKNLSFVTDQWEFKGRPDAIGIWHYSNQNTSKDNRYIVLDHKVTKTAITPFWVNVSDQMTGGAMLTANEFMISPPIDVLICNFVKESQTIQWLHGSRSISDIEIFKDKITHRVKEMYEGGEHFKRALHTFDTPCTWCEFQKSCVNIEPKSALSGIEEYQKAIL